MKKHNPLVELHAHIGASISPAVLWSIAHTQGIKLPTKDYWKFVDLILLSKSKKSNEKCKKQNEKRQIKNKI